MPCYRVDKDSTVQIDFDGSVFEHKDGYSRLLHLPINRKVVIGPGIDVEESDEEEPPM